MKKQHHPEARLVTIARAVEEGRKGRGLPDGWRWPLGWLVWLWEPNGTVHTRTLGAEASYVDAAAVRDEEMASGRYEKAWLSMQTDSK